MTWHIYLAPIVTVGRPHADTIGSKVVLLAPGVPTQHINTPASLRAWCVSFADVDAVTHATIAADPEVIAIGARATLRATLASVPARQRQAVLTWCDDRGIDVGDLTPAMTVRAFLRRIVDTAFMQQRLQYRRQEDGAVINVAPTGALDATGDRAALAAYLLLHYPTIERADLGGLTTRQIARRLTARLGGLPIALLDEDG